MLKITQSFLVSLLVAVINPSCSADSTCNRNYAQGLMSGEASSSSIILQGRLTQGKNLIKGDMPGTSGIARFEISVNLDFQNSFKTRWVEALHENDFIIKQKIKNLHSATRYYYRLLYGPDPNNIKATDTCTFKTLDRPDAESKVTFVVVTGMSYHNFHRSKGYKGPDKHLGYPTLKTILDIQPDFFVGTGDNVYYDSPSGKPAKTQKQLRKKYHEQFSQPRYIDLFAKVPTYWEKDDHDYRYNDSDNSTDRTPSPELGKRMFIEQLPVVDLEESNPITYRTYQFNRLLQIWFVEGRDYRSDNNMPDGPEKTLWGKEQRQWLKKTLLESKAVFKILISPTPMVGPDDGYKSDNHTNPKGFRYEGQQFFAWLADKGFLEKNFYIICGDRHWQYHAVHPSGIEEFSCGALIDTNSRLGRKAGDPNSTDTEGRIKQPYLQNPASGGFLAVTIEPGNSGQKAMISFDFYDENGTSLYSYKKIAAD